LGRKQPDVHWFLRRQSFTIAQAAQNYTAPAVNIETNPRAASDISRAQAIKAEVSGVLTGNQLSLLAKLKGQLCSSSGGFTFLNTA
jgi:hypothetical protein